MNDIVALLHCLTPYLSNTTLRQMKRIVFAVLCIPDRVTMLSIARWIEDGGSYRTVQRWYHTPLDWATILWTVVRVYVLKSDGEYLLAGDAVGISKAGKTTYGRGRFYASLAQRPINSVSFMTGSLLDVHARQSYPLQTEQREPPRPADETVAPPPKRNRGRPKGSKRHVKPVPQLTPDLVLLQGMVEGIIARIAPLTVKPLVLDGHFATYPATYAVRETGLHLISKFRHDAALYLPYTEPKPRRGPTPRYGQKLNYNHLPSEALIHSVTDEAYHSDTYQLRVYHQSFSEALNGGVVVKTHLKTGKRGHVVLFSTDLDLTADQIVDYYSLRFQIEFNFRDAKQYWGLEDFMNVQSVAVTNAVNLAFLMVHLSVVMLRPARDHQTDFSVLALKAQFRARRYRDQTIKMLPDPPGDDLVSPIWRRLTPLVAFAFAHSTVSPLNWRRYWYLASLKDVFSRKIVGWAMDEHMETGLVEQALHMVLARRQPEAGLLHHSDQGSRYASDAYRALLDEQHITVSMSGVGNCYDNAMKKSFFATLKTECASQLFATRAQARPAIFEYIEVFSNRQRLHSPLGYLSPEQFEQQFYTIR